MISLEVLIEANPQVIIAGSGIGEDADLPFQIVSTPSRVSNKLSKRANDPGAETAPK